MANMTFIELTVNAFDNVFRNRTNKKGIAKRGAGADSVRRPLRGIEVKDDTYAVIRVIRANGEEVPLVSSSYPGGSGPSYTNFLLQSVADSREEKMQIVETFGIPYIFFYGQRPHIIEVQSILINTLDFNWEAEFWDNYDRYLRGTKCAEMGARVYLFYEDNIVEGYMLRAQATKGAGDRGQQVGMQFSMLLTNYANVSMIENSTYPIRPTAMPGVYKGTLEADIDYIESIGIDAGAVPWMQRTEFSNELMLSIKSSDAVLRDAPLRGDITDNLDEWTGDTYMSTSQDLSVYDDETWPVWDEYMDERFWRRGNRLQQAEKDRLTDQAMEEACARGALANNPGFLRDMGLLGGGAGSSIGGMVGAGVGAGAGIGIGASAGATMGAGVFAGAGVGAAGGMGAGAYAGAGAWSGTGVGPGGAWSGSGTWSGSYAGAGAGYYGAQGVGYSPFGPPPAAGGGAIGFYSGAGYYGPGQYGTPGFGSGTAPASMGFGGYSAGAGAYAGWTPGGGASSGSYSYGGQVPPGFMPPSPGYAGPIWMPAPNYSGYGVMAGYSAGSSSPTGVGVQPGYAGGTFGAGTGFSGSLGSGGVYAGGAFYGGANSGTSYVAPGYAAGGYGGGTASSQYYASAYAGWDPVNGFYSGSQSNEEGPRNTSGPMPGTPGGGLFTTQSFPTGTSPVVTKPGAGSSQSNPYANISPERCEERANFLKGGPG